MSKLGRSIFLLLITFSLNGCFRESEENRVNISLTGSEDGLVPLLFFVRDPNDKTFHPVHNIKIESIFVDGVELFPSEKFALIEGGDVFSEFRYRGWRTINLVPGEYPNFFRKDFNETRVVYDSWKIPSTWKHIQIDYYERGIDGKNVRSYRLSCRRSEISNRSGKVNNGANAQKSD